MLMVKKKQNTPNRQIMTVLKKFWWAVPLFLVIAGVFVYIAASNYLIQLRFESTYMQLKDLSISFSRDSSQTTLTKSCKTNHYGFNSEIECGIDTVLYVENSYLSVAQGNIESHLKEAGFINVKLKSFSDKSSLEGTGTFYSKKNMGCTAYWGYTNDTSVRAIIHFYCREIVPDFLPGYERE